MLMRGRLMLMRRRNALNYRTKKTCNAFAGLARNPVDVLRRASDELGEFGGARQNLRRSGKVYLIYRTDDSESRLFCVPKIRECLCLDTLCYIDQKYRTLDGLERA